MSDPTATKSAGLFTTGKVPVPVPLAGVSIEADVRSFYAEVVVAHRYVNHEATPIEAVYVFPLDEGAAVCAFEAVVDGTLVVGEVHERDKAFEMYDDAMEAGHGAFLLDEERPDVFQASVGNLPPGKEVTVKLTYVTELAVDDGRLRFAIPTTVSPRYAPNEDKVGTGRPAAEALNPPVALSVPYGLNLSVRVAMPRGLTAIESPSHPIALRMDEGGATVALAQKDAALDRDFVLSIEAPGLDAPQAMVEREEDGTEAIGVAFAPAFATSSAPAELIFLVDRSGSMDGDSIEEVRHALQLCLRSMTPGCRFNIVGFGATHEALFPESRAYEQSTLDAASAHVAGIKADLGGTELLPALRFVLEQKGSAELPRQVVVLTDGEVTNTDAVIELAAAKASNARIFTFGIGAGASHHLVRGLARAGGGTAEFIYPGERIEPKVLRQLARLLSPALTNVCVEWVGGSVTQAPVKIPPVFAGGRLLVYGFVKGHRPATVRLTAAAPSGPLSFDLAVPDVAVGSRQTVSTLAARARIRELEGGSDWLSARGSQQKDRKATSARNEIIALSLRYGLISRETSFVAIERRDTPVTGDVKLRKVPIALTTGWGGRQRFTGSLSGHALKPGAAYLPNEAMRMAEAPAAAGRFSRLFSRPGSSRPKLESVRVVEDSVKEYFQSAALPVRRPSRSRAQANVARSGMHRLILLQSADGSWELTEDMASVVGHDLVELRTAVQGATGPQAEILRAWATALALAWLGRNAADAEDEWRLLAIKARKWLDMTAAVPPGGSTWIEEARRYIGK
jgi:Vault protein inter-alpha-trypsin domain/von Willebrand factor type A domain